MTVKFCYPLPLVPSALEQLKIAKFFTKMDLCSAYNLIQVWAGDECKTAFSTTSGHYEYRVMPFSLVNSPSIFHSFINNVFRDMLNRNVIICIDNNLVYSELLEEHIQHFRDVLKCLIQHQHYAKAEKCEFHLTSLSFLIHANSTQWREIMMLVMGSCWSLKLHSRNGIIGLREQDSQF